MFPTYISCVDWAVRASMVLGLALAAMPLLKGRSAVARRIVLSVALASVLVIPFVPAWHVDMNGAADAGRTLIGRAVAEPGVAAEAASGATDGAIATPATTTRPVDWVFLVWALGVVVVATRFAIGHLVARRIVARGSKPCEAWEHAIGEAEHKTGIRAVIRVSPAIDAPAVTGILAPVVVVPASSSSWGAERKLSVLLHELAHVAAHDLDVQLLASIVCSLHWFNPLAWLATSRLRLERELAADEAVLRSGMRASTYAADLLAIAGPAPLGTVAVAEKPITSRITAILSKERPAVIGPKAAAAFALGTTAMTLGLACTSTTSPAEPAPHVALPGASTSPSAPSTNRELQSFVDAELERAKTEWHASGGAIVVMTPKGEPLAEAGEAGLPIVTGSTMKGVLLAAAIDEGVVSETDVFDCSRGERGGKVLHDAAAHKELTLPEMLAVSSNVGFAQVFDRLGGARTRDSFERFHFAAPSHLAAAPAGDWNAGLTAIGATMNATPRQVAGAYAALANGGGGIVKPATAARVTALLEGVVASEHGTGKKAKVAGVRVAGKTGSSEWTASDGKAKTYASFVGYAPADAPRVVIFVGVESPVGDQPWGGEVAAPVFARIATRALDPVGASPNRR